MRKRCKKSMNKSIDIWLSKNDIITKLIREKTILKNRRKNKKVIDKS